MKARRSFFSSLIFSLTVWWAAGIVLLEQLQAAEIALVNAGFDFYSYRSLAPGITHPNPGGFSIGANHLTPVTYNPVLDGEYVPGSFPEDDLCVVPGWVGSSSGSGAQTLNQDARHTYWMTNNYPEWGNAVGYVTLGMGNHLWSIPYANLLQPNTCYTLTATWYGRSAGPLPSDIVFGLQTGIFGSYTDLPSGVLSKLSPSTSGPGWLRYVVTTGPNVAPGPLVIHVQAPSMLPVYAQLCIDDIRLTTMVIPEPGSLICLACGSIVSLLHFVWRKEK